MVCKNCPYVPNSGNNSKISSMRVVDDSGRIVRVAVRNNKDFTAFVRSMGGVGLVGRDSDRLVRRKDELIDGEIYTTWFPKNNASFGQGLSCADGAAAVTQYMCFPVDVSYEEPRDVNAS